jgi:hypothetical protein
MGVCTPFNTWVCHWLLRQKLQRDVAGHCLITT